MLDQMDQCGVWYMPDIVPTIKEKYRPRNRFGTVGSSLTDTAIYL